MTPFTFEGDPRAEAHVTADLERVVDAILTEAGASPPLAVFLLGGYARGEGTVVVGEDGARHGFNDYDFLVVFARRPPRAERYAQLARRLAGELGIDFVDLGLATPRDLAAAPPTLFWYELGEAHRLLWSGPEGAPRLPRFRPGELDPEEGSRLLLNRGMALLWAGARLWEGPLPGSGEIRRDPAELRFASIAAHKAIAAVGDAALLRAHAYVPCQANRQETLASRPELTAWAGAGFLEAYARAMAFRRRPAVGAPAEVASLWWEAREHHERGFRAEEAARLGAAIPLWDAYPRLLRAGEKKRDLSRPRGALRRVRRAMRGETGDAPETAWRLGMVELLYGLRTNPAGLRSGTAWNERALDLVRRWHP